VWLAKNLLMQPQLADSPNQSAESRIQITLFSLLATMMNATLATCLPLVLSTACFSVSIGQEVARRKSAAQPRTPKASPMDRMRLRAISAALQFTQSMVLRGQ
jgi:hypothetical protein